MKLQQLTIALTTGMIISGAVQADQDDEITIRMMEINESTPDTVTKIIPLPGKDKSLQQQKRSTTQKNGESKADPASLTEEEQLRIREMEQEQLQQMQEQRIEAEIQHNEQVQEQLIEQESGSETIKNMGPNP